MLHNPTVLHMHLQMIMECCASINVQISMRNWLKDETKKSFLIMGSHQYAAVLRPIMRSLADWDRQLRMELDEKEVMGKLAPLALDLTHTKNNHLWLHHCLRLLTVDRFLWAFTVRHFPEQWFDDQYPRQAPLHDWAGIQATVRKEPLKGKHQKDNGTDNRDNSESRFRKAYYFTNRTAMDVMQSLIQLPYLETSFRKETQATPESVSIVEGMMNFLNNCTSTTRGVQIERNITAAALALRALMVVVSWHPCNVSNLQLSHLPSLLIEGSVQSR